MSLSLSHSSVLDTPQPPSGSSAPAWKDEVSARVRDHRARRGRVPENQPALPGMEAAVSVSSIAARVAERYARVPSWKEMLAAQTAAQTTAQPAQASADPLPARTRPQRARAERAPEARTAEPEPYQRDLLRYSVSADSLPAPRTAPAQAHAESGARPRPAIAEIADPLEEAIIEPDRPLPARVIQFPRELVAPRKARPRLAEGPLVEGSAAAAASVAEPPVASATSVITSAAPTETAPAPAAESPEQLRIFEAPPEAAAPRAAPSAAQPARTSEWLSICLEPEKPAREIKPRASAVEELPLFVAPFADRLMAGVVDVALTLGAFLLFVLVFAICTTHPPAGRPAVAGAAASLLAMWVLYQYLFFSLSAATPGMRYAKIALCTFDDENPARHTMRSRVAAQLFSALPLGLGFLWMAFDEDGLGWHDRITQTYQRSYREM